MPAAAAKRDVIGKPGTVQLNTRIERDLKMAGDAALASAGYTPSQAVRGLWEFAVRNADAPERLHDVIDSSSVRDRSERAHRKLEGAKAGWSICERFADDAVPMQTTPYRDLRGEIIEERMRDRGLI